MVMKSFTRVSMTVNIDPSKVDYYKEQIKKRFGNQIVVRFKDNEAIIENDLINDYRVHESLVYILTEGKHGKDL